MAKADRLYSAQEGAYMTRLTISSFRAKVRKLKINGKRRGKRFSNMNRVLSSCDPFAMKDRLLRRPCSTLFSPTATPSEAVDRRQSLSIPA
jgi:hypothetical protein